MASSCGLHAHSGTFLVKILEQMSVVNFMEYSLGTTAEGFVPSHAPLKNNKHLNIPFKSTQPRRGKKKVRITKPNSFIPGLCLWEGEWVGGASILSVMRNMAPDMKLLWLPSFFTSALIIFSVSETEQWCLHAPGTQMGIFTFHVAETAGR